MTAENVAVEKITEMVEQLKALLGAEKKSCIVFRGRYGHIAEALGNLIMPIYAEKKAVADVVRRSMGRVGSRQYAEAKARMPEIKHMSHEESAELVDRMFIDPASVDLAAQTDKTLYLMLERIHEIKVRGFLSVYDQFVGTAPAEVAPVALAVPAGRTFRIETTWKTCTLIKLQDGRISGSALERKPRSMDSKEWLAQARQRAEQAGDAWSKSLT